MGGQGAASAVCRARALGERFHHPAVLLTGRQHPTPLPLPCPSPSPPVQTANELMETSAAKYVVWDATAAEGDYASTFK